jgi:site-specific recombinase XerD
MLTVKRDLGQDVTMKRTSSTEGSALTLAVAGFLETCRSANTKAAYRTDLGHLAMWCAGDEQLNLLTVDASALARYRAACELAGASPATVARRLSAITSFRTYAAEQGLEPALGSERRVARPRLQSASSADVLSDAEADALLAAADQVGARTGVLIRLLMLDGLKVGEALRADAVDVHGRPPQVTLDVPGRVAPKIALQPETSAVLRRYVGRRRDGPLLLSERRGQPRARLTRFGIDYLIKQAAQTAGLDRTISGNTLRRRYVIAAHADGTDLDAIRHNAGHATPRSTRRYLARDAASDE